MYSDESNKKAASSNVNAFLEMTVTTNNKKVVFNCSKRDNLVEYIKDKI